jgi:hypothetical protein
MPKLHWLERWQQREGDELLYASLSDLPREDLPRVPETPPEARRLWPWYVRHPEQIPLAPGRRRDPYAGLVSEERRPAHDHPR